MTLQSRQRAAAGPALKSSNSRRRNQLKQLHNPLCTADLRCFQRHAVSLLLGHQTHEIDNTVFRDNLDPSAGRVRARKQF